MFSELPKLFDRNFAIGFFLPVALFLIAALSVLAGIPAVSAHLAVGTKDLVTGLTAAAVATWGLAIGLVALNYVLIRFLEGYYWPLNRWGFLKKRQVDRWKSLSKELDELENEWVTHAKEYGNPPRELVDKRNQLMRRRVSEFPDEQGLILPTAFGNIVRAFETYPRIMYGIDSIPGWIRLLSVIPKDFQTYIESAKAHLDLCVNFLYLSVLLGLICVVRLSFAFDTWTLVLLALSLAIAAGMYSTAKGAARHWGTFVKAAFDLHLDALAAKLGYTKLPRTANARRTFWYQISQSLIYHLPLDRSRERLSYK